MGGTSAASGRFPQLVYSALSWLLGVVLIHAFILWVCDVNVKVSTVISCEALFNLIFGTSSIILTSVDSGTRSLIYLQIEKIHTISEEIR